MRPNYNRSARGHNQAPRIMDARRAGTCAQCGLPFDAGASILWEPSTGQAYCASSARYQAEAERQRLDAFNNAHGMADAQW